MISFAVVDLPPPFGPVITTNFPSSTVRLISLIMPFSPFSSFTSKERFSNLSIMTLLPLFFFCIRSKPFVAQNVYFYVFPWGPKGRTTYSIYYLQLNYYYNLPLTAKNVCSICTASPASSLKEWLRECRCRGSCWRTAKNSVLCSLDELSIFLRFML